MIKEAVILAAGEGKRLKQTLPYENLKEIPKPLIQVAGKEIIRYNIDAIKDYVEKIVIVINPAKEKTFEKIKNGKIIFAFQEKPLGTAHALYCAKDFVEDELFLVMMGDDIIIDDFEKILKINEPTVFGYEVEDVSNFGALITKNDKLERIAEKELIDRSTKNFKELWNRI